MQYPTTHTDAGAKAALTDEYARAIAELKATIRSLGDDAITKVVDHETNDEDCRSIQTILTHVVRSGYGYAIAIRRRQGEELAYRVRQQLPSADAYCAALDDVMAYNEQLFLDYPGLPLETYDEDAKIKANWGQIYDVEQLFEHAIVHILRHRRQIEGFLGKGGLLIVE